MIHTSIGVYANGTFKTNGVSSENIVQHIGYNQQARPGRALFVDGVCLNKGYLSYEEVEEWLKRCKDIKHFKDTAPYH